jgi:hypothetical protein
MVSTDYGLTWSAKATSLAWTGVGMSNDGLFQLATAYSGGAFSSFDYGSTWSQISYIPTSATLNGCAVSGDGSHALTGAYGGSLYYMYAQPL